MRFERMSMAFLCAGIALCGSSAHAAWPEGEFIRNWGGNLAILPAVLWWMLVLGWVATSDWITQDSAELNLKMNMWAVVSTFPFLLMALIGWWIPSSIATLLLMSIAWLAPAITYALQHNAKVAPNKKVLTLGHGRRIASKLLRPLGIQIDAEFVKSGDIIPVVTFHAAGGNSPAEDEARLQAATATAGFEGARQVMVTAVMARASGVLLDYAQQSVAVRHEVDGVWHSREPILREPADPMLVSFKTLAGLDPKNRKSKQHSRFTIKVDNKPWNCKISSQGVPTGERVHVQLESATIPFKKLTDLGMSEAMALKISDLLKLEQGIFVVSSPAASGLTTSFDIVVGAADRLLRDFVSIEDGLVTPREIQNVKPFKWDLRQGLSPVATLELAMREYPSGIVTRDLTDGPLAVELAKQAGNQRFVILGLQAVDAIDAIEKLIALGVPRESLGKILLGVISQRLVRRLCPKCLEEYPTPPEFLAKLRIPAERLPTLRRQSKIGCPLCGGTGFMNRMAIFEVASGENLRRALAGKADRNVLRQAALKDGMKQLKDEGMALALKGTTSMEEMQRVFKSG